MRDIGKKRIEMQRLIGDSFSLAYLPCAVICDFLVDAGFHIVNKPDVSEKAFSWFEPGDFDETCPLVTPSSRVLRLCSENRAISFLREDPKVYALIVSDRDSLAQELRPFRARILQIRKAGETRSVVSIIESLFMQSVVWESRIQSIIDNEASDDASVVSLLDVGSMILEGFLCIFDEEGVPVSQCTYYGLPFKDFQAISCFVRQGEQAVDFEQATESELLNVRLIELNDARYLLAPLSINSIRIGSLLLHLGEHASAFALAAMLQHFSMSVIKLIVRQQSSPFGRAMTENYYLSALIQGVHLEREALELCRTELGFPKNAQFKVLAIDVNDCRGVKRGELVERISNFNNGKAHCFFFKGYLAGVLFAEPEEGTLLSNQQTIAEIQSQIFQPFQIQCAFSQVFNAMDDICQGFRQSVYALENRDLILKEYLIADGEEECAALAFDAALPYFILGEAEKRNEIVDFFANRTLGVPKTLAQECLSDGTVDFALLWRYLSNDGNASKVGRLMYMHRNSVLYHIKQLEKRFAMSLDDRLTRERMMMEFRVIFKQFDEVKLKKLFDLEIQGEC